MAALSNLFTPNIEKMAAKNDVAGLVKALSHKEFKIFYEAGLALQKIGQPAVVPLIAALSDPQQKLDVRGRAASILGKIGDPRAVDPLIKSLDQPMPLNWDAAQALGKIGAHTSDQALRQKTTAALTTTLNRDSSMAKYAYKGLMEMGEFASPNITYSDHYLDETLSVGDSLRRLTLVEAEADPYSVALTYHWHRELTHQEADKLDSRLRAYIACAIYDAATHAQLKCFHGEKHGKRPGFNINSPSITYSLQEAHFDTDNQICFLRVGPVAINSGQRTDPNRERVLSGLAEGFRAMFSELTV